KLVLIEFRLVTGNPLYGREAVRIGVQHRVPEKLIHVPVNTVGSRFCYDVDDGAGVATVFGVEGIGQNAKFVDTVRRGLHGGQVDELVVGISAVDTKIVRTAASPIYRHCSGFVATVDNRVA